MNRDISGDYKYLFHENDAVKSMNENNINIFTFDVLNSVRHYITYLLYCHALIKQLSLPISNSPSIQNCI